MSFDWSEYVDVAQELAIQAKSNSPHQEANQRASIAVTCDCVPFFDEIIWEYIDSLAKALGEGDKHTDDGLMECPLHLDELAIFGTLTRELLQPREHVLAHMGHDQSFRLKFVQMGHQGAKIQVKFDLLLKKVRLCNQKVGSLRCWQQGLGPFRIARVGDTFPVTLHAQGQGRVSRGVLNAVGGDDHFTQCLRLIGC